VKNDPRNVFTDKHPSNQHPLKNSILENLKTFNFSSLLTLENGLRVLVYPVSPYIS
jgi:hypothetical protein